MKILFSSSDPGSAQQNESISRQLNIGNNDKIALISTSLASKYYSSDFEKKFILNNDSLEKTKKISDFIKLFKPDFIITGLSVKKNNLDHITCKIANDLKIKTGTIQDYYGHYGSFNNNVKPKYFFVIDDYAKLLTEKISSSINVIKTGSPKHYDYHFKIKEWLNEEKKIKIKNKEIIFFLQPFNTPGVESNFISLCEAIQEVNPGYSLNVKPHPINEQSKQILSLSNKYNLNIINFKDKSPEILLLYFDNIFNCISTIAFDYYFLNYEVLSNKRFNLFNVLIGNDIIKYCSKMNFDISFTPQYLNGENLVNDTMLKKSIELIFNDRKYIKNKSQTFLNVYENIAAKKIINFIKESVK